MIFVEKKILLENQQKTTLITKYIHVCTSHHQLHNYANTIHNTK